MNRTDVLADLAKTWDQRPDMSLAELIGTAVAMNDPQIRMDTGLLDVSDLTLALGLRRMREL